MLLSKKKKEKKKKKKKNIRPHPHMDPNKMPGVYGGTAEYQKNYYI